MQVVHQPFEILKMKLKKAYKRYNHIKQDPNSCDNWIGQLIEAQAQSTSQKKLLSGNNFGVKNK